MLSMYISINVYLVPRAVDVAGSPIALFFFFLILLFFFF